MVYLVYSYFGFGLVGLGIIFYFLDSGSRSVLYYFEVLFSYSGSSIYLCFWVTLTRSLSYSTMNILVATFTVATTDDLQRHHF